MFKIGIGYDVHAFTGGSAVTIGGVSIPHDKGIIAHSDGDVALHALTDAMLGAIAAGSIGAHFPPSDPKWKNSSSEVFIRYAYALIKEQSYSISNIDLVVVCEEPKIMPHALKIRENISKVMSLDINQVNIKAVTTEGLGFLGRKEGIAAQAIVLLHKIPEHDQMV